MRPIDFFQEQRAYRDSSLQLFGLIYLGIAGITLPVGYLITIVLSYTLVPFALGLYCIIVASGESYLPAFHWVNSQPVRTDATIVFAVLVAIRLFSLARARMSVLEQPGSEFARRLGAHPLKGADQDSLLQILRNVAEEMGIASGAGYVQLYVLEGDHGINAIAVGIPQEDVALVVTRRALEVLDRSELQALVAHVMSYIVHGDIRRDLRIAAWVDTLDLMRRAGMIMAFPTSERRSDGKNPAGLIAMSLGVGIAALGWIGGMLARVAQANVYRLRERLADAATIQFTRDQGSLVRLLAKIPTTPGESVVHAEGALALKHLFFAPIDHAGRRMSDLERALGDSDHSIRERLEALAPDQDWSRM